MEALRHFIIGWSPVVLLVAFVIISITINEAIEALKDLLEVMGEERADQAALRRAELDRYELETARLYPTTEA